MTILSSEQELWNVSQIETTSSIVKQHTLAIYVGFAYLFTSLCCIPAGLVAIGKGWVLPPPFIDLISLNLADAEQAMVFLAFTLGVYGPLVAAVTASLLTGGRPAIRWLRGGIMKWHIGLHWFLVVMFLPIIINLMGSVPAVLMGSSYSPAIPLQYFLLYLGYQLITSGMEEVGWRGYALPCLQRRYTAERSSWILGTIWGVWHFPSIVFLYYAAGPFLANNLFASLISIIGLTFVYTWLYNNMESIIMMIIFHGWSNTLGLYMVNAFNNPMTVVLTVALHWLLAIILVRRYGKENLSRITRPIM
jgi:membrane protease YdiL (CAAX protease family)